MRRRDIVDVQNAEHPILGADEWAADGRSDLLHENRLAAEARILTGVVGKDRHLVLDHLARDRLRHRPRLGAATLVAGNLGRELSAFLAQLNRDGTVDTAWNSSAGPDAAVGFIAVGLSAVNSLEPWLGRVFRKAKLFQPL